MRKLPAFDSDANFRSESRELSGCVLVLVQMLPSTSPLVVFDSEFQFQK